MVPSLIRRNEATAPSRETGMSSERQRAMEGPSARAVGAVAKVRGLDEGERIGGVAFLLVTFLCPRKKKSLATGEIPMRRSRINNPAVGQELDRAPPKIVPSRSTLFAAAQSATHPPRLPPACQRSADEFRDLPAPRRRSRYR